MTAEAGREVRVLLVDDDPALADLAATQLERVDGSLTVEVEHGARAALERFPDAGVDCVVSDYDMPGLNGLAFLEAVRESRPELPFVLFTGKGSEEIASEAISAGVTDYLQKGTGTDQWTVLANRVANAAARYRAEQSARESRRRFTSLIENATDVITVFDPDGTIRYESPSLERVLGYEPAALEGDHLSEYVHPDDWPEVETAFARTVEGEAEEASVECRFRHADGSWRWLEARGRNLLDEPAVDGIVANSRDVTERRRRERQLTERRETIASLTAFTAGLQACETPREAAERTVDGAGEVLDLYSCYVGLVDDDVIHPVATGPNTSLERVASMAVEEGIAGMTYRREEPFLVRTVDDWPEAAPQGPFESAISVPLGDHGVFQAAAAEPGAFDETDLELARLLCAHLRATLDRIDREQALRDQEAFAQELLDALPDPFYAVRPDGSLERWNEEFVEVTGYEGAELRGRDALSLVPEPDRDRLGRAIGDVVAGGDAVTEESAIVAADGEELPHEFNSTRVRDGDGEPLVVGVARDVTDRRARQCTLERQNERLAQFASVVSHDLRNPLEIAQGYLQLARGAVADAGPVDADGTGVGRPGRDDTGAGGGNAPERDDDTTAAGDDATTAAGDDATTTAEATTGSPGAVTDPATDRDAPDGRAAGVDGAGRSWSDATVADPGVVPDPDVDGATIAGYLDDVAAAHERMERLIDDVLALAREGELVEEVVPTSPRVVAESAWSYVETGDAELVVESAPTIYADGARLQRAVENLVRNAVEHAGHAPTVRIGVESDRLYVADDGPGIPPDDREEVLRAGITTTDDGTGFGLPIVVEIADAHGWSIEVTESREGGTRVEFVGVRDA